MKGYLFLLNVDNNIIKVIMNTLISLNTLKTVTTLKTLPVQVSVLFLSLFHWQGTAVEEKRQC